MYLGLFLTTSMEDDAERVQCLLMNNSLGLNVQGKVRIVGPVAFSTAF